MDHCYEDEWNCHTDSVQYKKREENDRVYVFLAGLNQELDEVRGRILGRKPLPSIREVFSEVHREETRRNVMLKKVESRSEPETESSALVSRGIDLDGEKRRKPCEYCKRPWHTRDTCWKLHGKPSNFKKKYGGDGKALQTGSEDSQKQQVDSETPAFTKEQLSQLYKLFKSPQFSVNPTCSFAQNGNVLTVALSCKTSNPSCSWIIDYGATDDMTSSSQLLSSYSPCAGDKKIKIADESLSVIASMGFIIISPTLTLHKVLHVPNLSCNFLSISKLTSDLKCRANFFPYFYEFQELTTGRIIGCARESGGLYFLENESSMTRSAQNTCYGSISITSNKQIML